MLNRLVSNFVLGFFVVVLFVVYGMAKQTPVYPGDSKLLANRQNSSTGENTKTEDVQVAGVLFGTAEVVLPSGKVVVARVANTPEERTQGLSGTQPLKDNEGMLFAFETPDVYRMWMKDMNYDLDIVWFDADGRVVYVVEQAKAPQPGTADHNLPRYLNATPASYVLEIPAGTAVSQGIEVGAQISIK
jgi:uncharacterized membrane protein (UPF0127 family)